MANETTPADACCSACVEGASASAGAPNTASALDAFAEVVDAARRDVAREQTDFLGRMAQALGTYEGIFDDHPDGELPADVQEDAEGQMLGLAGLAFAQLIMLRHPIDPLAAFAQIDLATRDGYIGNLRAKLALAMVALEILADLISAETPDGLTPTEADDARYRKAKPLFQALDMEIAGGDDRFDPIGWCFDWPGDLNEHEKAARATLSGQGGANGYS